jgi:uncharacterized protein CbrC (UPF0167 family)
MMTKQLELPQFIYLPNAYEIGLFKEEAFTCDICKTEQNFRYVGAYYMEKVTSKGTVKVTNPEHKICAYCIESGKAAELLKADFKDIDILEQACYNTEHIDEEKCDTVIQTWLYQTPNFSALETEIWPICCSDFTAFIGYLGTGNEIAEFLHLGNGKDPSETTAKLEGKSVEELFQVLQAAFEVEVQRLHEVGIEVKNGEILAQRLKTEENYAVGYLFKCIDCDKYYLHVDFIQKT